VRGGHTARIARLATFAVVATSLGVLTSCNASLSGGARDAFARFVKCPDDQTTVVPRPDYRASSRSSSSASDDTGDPGTMAYWNKRQNGEPTRPATQDVACENFEVTGCGQRAVFCCHHPMARDSAGAQAERTDTVECEHQ